MAEFAASGRMAREGATFFEDPEKITAIYNTGRLPYIIYQEEGFTHYITGKPVVVNKGFISVKTEGKINRYINGAKIGIPYNKIEDNQILLERQHLLYVELGAIQDV